MITATESTFVNSCFGEQLRRKVNSECTAALYEKHGHLVYQKCLQMTKSAEDAHDLSQEIWLKVMNNIHRFRSEAKYSTWLYSITYNHCVDFIRRRNRRQKLHDHYQTEASYFGSGEFPEFADGNATHAESEALLDGVKQLTSDKKLNILWFKYALGMSIKEISKKLSISDSAVKMRLKRARQTLKMQVEANFALSVN